MKQQSTAKGFAVLSAAGMIVKVISLLYLPFLTRIINDDGYGVYSVVYSIFTFAYVITNSGIPVAISKMVSELTATGNYKDAHKTFKVARALLLLLGFATAIILMILAKPVTRIANSEAAFLGVIALSPAIFITSVMSAYRGYFQGMGDMTPTAISQVGEQIINTIFSLVFAALLIGKGVELGVMGATIGTTLGALVACIYLIVVYERTKFTSGKNENMNTDIKRLSNKAILRRLVKYCVPITTSVGLQNAGNLIDTANINNRLSAAGYDETTVHKKFGQLNVYSSLIRVPLTFITALSAAALPSIAGAAAVGDRKLVREKINYVYKICAIVALPAAVGLSVLSKPIYEILFHKFVEGHKLLAIGAIVVVIQAFVQIQVTVLQSVGRLYSALIAILIGIIAKIATNYILVADTGINITGAVYANIIYFMIPLIINSFNMRKALRIRISLIRAMAKPAMASAFMGVVVYFSYLGINTLFTSMKSNFIIKCTVLVFPILLGGLAYVYALIIIGGITKDDLNSMSPRLVRLIPDFLKSRIR
jgi:stage V sporulation protein B